MKVECIICNGPHIETDDGRKHAVVSSEDLDRAVTRNQAEAKKRAEERDATVHANAEEWSNGVRCAVTGKALPHEDLAWKSIPRNPKENIRSVFESCIRHDGSAIVFYCGYGSKHDGSIILFGISDEALDAMLADGRARILGEYM